MKRDSGLTNWGRVATTAVLCWASLAMASEAPFAQVDLGPADVEQGLANTQRSPGTDGENVPEICGPASDQRQARRNLGTAAFEANDFYFYFNVLDPAVKGDAHVIVEAVVLDEPVAAGTTLRLEYTNVRALDSLDLPNVFAPHADVVTLAGTGSWCRYAWEIHDAGFRTLMQGVADFRLGVSTPHRVCVDRVRVTGEAQAASRFAIARWSTSPGGRSSSGAYVLSGSIGQSDEGPVIAGGLYTLRGGFYPFLATTSEPVAPALTVSITDGLLALSWPSTSRGWVLQETDSLGFATWIEVPIPPADDGVSQTVLLRPQSGHRFYRLLKP